MKHDKALSAFVGRFLLVLPLLLLATGAGASNFKVNYSFQGGLDGATPSNVVADTAGNLYATTFSGGAFNAGAIVKLTQSGGVWTNTVLYSFCSKASCPDGWAPDRELVIDKKGNLYGITLWGGNPACQYGCGVAFRLHPANGGWKYQTIHRFDPSAGFYPQASLTFDKAGNLFGTTSDASGLGHGTVFELTLSHGRWVHNVIYAFTEIGNDGSGPFSGVTIDQTGNLYGTTAYGGEHGAGTVYQISSANGGWTHKTIYSFNNDRIDGQIPYSGVTVDAAGIVYGATYGGGDFTGPICGNGCGTIYQLIPSGDAWTETVLYRFSGGADGAFPSSHVVFDQTGNIYGAATQGGSPRCDDGYGCGVVFELTPGGSTWSQSVLHRFTGNKDGWAPREVFFDDKGKLHGNAAFGGLYNSGNLFSLKP